ncbi:hypothetical protein [Streptomyces sp. GbtcB6]|nr:hypothetical protein [Streptomyces sp. GbtcB6]
MVFSAGGWAAFVGAVRGAFQQLTSEVGFRDGVARATRHRPRIPQDG